MVPSGLHWEGSRENGGAVCNAPNQAAVGGLSDAETITSLWEGKITMIWRNPNFDTIAVNEQH
jgi:hypothetical protein